MRHLTEHEIIKLFEKGESFLSSTQVDHLRKCPFCQEEYNQQLKTHNVLKDIHPILAPDLLPKNVLTKLSQLNLKLKPKEKTDWLFLLAIMFLFFVAFWYTYFGNLDIFPIDYLHGIQKYTPEIISQNFNITIKEHFSRLMLVGNKVIYLMLGIISIALYWVLDRHLHKLIRFKKS